MPIALLGDPAFANAGAVSTGRARVRTAGNVLGTPVSPTDWKEPATLDVFAHDRLHDRG